MDIRKAVALHQAGRLVEAQAAYRALLQQAPLNSDAWHFLGIAHAQLGQPLDAVKCIEKALAIAPDNAKAHFNLGLALIELNRPAEAIRCFERALISQPDDAETHHMLGNVFKGQHMLNEAVASYRQALSLKPDFAEAHNNLGIALHEQGKPDAAVASFQQAISFKPDFAEAHNNLGMALQEQGKLDQAVKSFHCALALEPDFAEAHNNLGIVLHAQGKRDAAVASYLQALSYRPDFADAHNNFGIALQKEGKLDAAIGSFRTALSLKPDFAKAHNNLGIVLQKQGKLDAAIRSYRTALSLDPDFAEAYTGLGTALREQGKLDEAIASCRQALKLKPDYADAYSNLLFIDGYHALLDPPQYLSLARGWEQACVPARDRQIARGRTFAGTPLAGRRLRVGYVSGDFRDHAVSYFIEQLFRHHDRTRIELFAYQTESPQDDATARLQSLADHWTLLSGMSDAAARDRIEADGIDVLIDLSGHTEHNGLGVFARRAAPVQAHYLGFFASTGLTEMDYWIGDDIVTPAESDGHFSEHLWRLPRTWVSYEGRSEAPLPCWRPAADGTVCVGSFNNLNKLTPATLALWAEVLQALPEGRLLLKTKQLADTGNRERILGTMSSHGISSHRIELEDGSATPGWAEHMAHYDRLDIALDPVGAVGGGTTTCDALWMGVPVVTLRGDRMVSRMTASMLTALGGTGWIALSEAEYVEKVVALARDVSLRENLRARQRGTMALSTLCNGRDLSIALENAYLEMFKRWLQGKNNAMLQSR